MPYPSPANFLPLRSLKQELFDLRNQKRDAEIHFTLGLLEEEKGNVYDAWLHYLYIRNDHYLLSCASAHKELLSTNLTPEMLNIAKMHAAEVTNQHFNRFIESRDHFYDLLSKAYATDCVESLKKTRKNISVELYTLRKKHGFINVIQLTGKHSLYARVSYLYDLDLLLSKLIDIKTGNTSPSHSPDLKGIQYGQSILKYMRNRLKLGSHAASTHNFSFAVLQLNHVPGHINPASFSCIQAYVEALQNSLEKYVNKYADFFTSVLASEEASQTCKSPQSKSSLKN